MKIKVTFKDPDALQDCIRDEVERIEWPGISDENEVEALRQERTKTVSEICSKWFEYGEYLTVEIDTDANTATVLEAE